MLFSAIMSKKGLPVINRDNQIWFSSNKVIDIMSSLSTTIEFYGPSPSYKHSIIVRWFCTDIVLNCVTNICVFLTKVRKSPSCVSVWIRELSIR